MKLSQFYNRVVKLGSERDPRSNAHIKSYADTAILYGNPDAVIEKVLIGIDIESAELLLAEKLRNAQGLDLVLSHHPEGKAFVSLAEVMRVQVDLLIRAGLPRSVAAHLLEERMREVDRRIISSNHMRPVDTARILDLPFMCAHTPADNHVSSFLQSLFAREKPEKTGDILDILLQIPEYKLARDELGCGPRIILGSPKRRVGKILLEMTGGTEGNKEAYDKLAKAGVKTLVSMHLSEDHFRKVKEANLNVVIAGHISSDTLGLNLLLDRLEKEGPLQVTGCSGFRRIKRG